MMYFFFYKVDFKDKQSNMILLIQIRKIQIFFSLRIAKKYLKNNYNFFLKLLKIMVKIIFYLKK